MLEFSKCPGCGDTSVQTQVWKDDINDEDGKTHWVLMVGMVSKQIVYCPSCGEFLPLIIQEWELDHSEDEVDG